MKHVSSKNQSYKRGVLLREWSPDQSTDQPRSRAVFGSRGSAPLGLSLLAQMVGGGGRCRGTTRPTIRGRPGARVAPQRCPILLTGTSSISYSRFRWKPAPLALVQYCRRIAVA